MAAVVEDEAVVEEFSEDVDDEDDDDEDDDDDDDDSADVEHTSGPSAFAVDFGVGVFLCCCIGAAQKLCCAAVLVVVLLFWLLLLLLLWAVMVGEDIDNVVGLAKDTLAVRCAPKTLVESIKSRFITALPLPDDTLPKEAVMAVSQGSTVPNIFGALSALQSALLLLSVSSQPSAISVNVHCAGVAEIKR